MKSIKKILVSIAIASCLCSCVVHASDTTLDMDKRLSHNKGSERSYINPVVVYNTMDDEGVILLKELKEDFYSSIDAGVSYEKNVASYVVPPSTYEVVMKDDEGNRYSETVVVESIEDEEKVQPVIIRKVDKVSGRVMGYDTEYISLNQYTFISIPDVEGMSSYDAVKIAFIRDKKSPVTVTYYYERD